jgi:RNA polymerase sigma factor (sigma-70 family)
MSTKEWSVLPNDHETMLAVRDGDLDLLGLLFERHRLKLHRFFMGMTGRPAESEDLVQEVFLRMLRHRHTYRDDSRFNAWMFQIARNARIDAFRRSRFERSIDNAPDIASPDPDPAVCLEKEAESALLRRALSMLPEEKREVIVLSRFEDMEFREIARILGARETTVKVRAHRAVKELGELVRRLAEKGTE